MNRYSTRCVLAAVLALAAVACGDDDPITNPGNQAPVITIASNATFGMAQITTFAFAASVVEPNLNPVSVRWTFSDGTVVNGNNVWRRFNDPGSYEVFATATDHLGASTESNKVTVTVGTFSGEWSGEIDLTPCGGGSKPISASLSQAGAVVTGTVTLPDGLCSSAGGTASIGSGDPGQVFGSGSLRLRIVVPAAIDASLAGQLSTDTNSITGTLEEGDTSDIPFTLNRQ